MVGNDAIADRKALATESYRRLVADYSDAALSEIRSEDRVWRLTLRRRKRFSRRRRGMFRQRNKMLIFEEQEPIRPRRKFDVTITLGGNTRGDAASLLRHFANLIENGSDSCVTGGCSNGGILKVNVDDSMTPEKYTKELMGYLENARRDG